MKQIQRILFDAQERHGELIESHCGVYVSEEGGKPKIHIFDIEENDGVGVNANLPQACDALRQEFFPEMALSEIDWTLTAGIDHSDFSFEEVDGFPIKMRIGQDVHMATNMVARSMARFEKALNSEEGFTEDLFAGTGFRDGDAIDYHIVPLPDHPESFMYFKREYTRHMLDKFTAVCVDADMFVEHWKQQAKQTRSGESRLGMSNQSDYESGLLQSDKDTSIKHIWGQNGGSMMGMPHFTYMPSMEKPMAFVNGRHRTFNAINLGAPFVPLEMEVGKATEEFRDKFEWRPRHDTKIAPEVPISAHLDRSIG